MNLQHLYAFVWLRWRLRINQIKHAGPINTVLIVVLAVLAVIGGLGMFLVALLGGLLLLPHASPWVLMFVWDGLVLGFLFSWCLGLATDLQRAESLALDRFLHLPVSVSGAFLINYLSSLMSLSLILFLPAMVGLCVAQVAVFGVLHVLAVPLLAAFLLAVTALTYQLQGWLASLMANKRRRRTVLVVATMVVIVLAQLPSFVGLLQSRGTARAYDPVRALQAEEVELQRKLAIRQITASEYQQQMEEITRRRVQEKVEAARQVQQRLEEYGRTANAVLPVGWLPLGVADLVRGDATAALLGTAGLALIAGVSLRRAYRTTLRLYTGAFSAGRKPAAPPPARAAAGRVPANWLERRLPGVSEQVAIVTLAGLRSLTRAPEIKLLLLAPLLLMGMFGTTMVAHRAEIPVPLRPLLVPGAMAMILLTTVGLLGNQFGFERAGFRAFVLSPARRRDLLLGKNLALAPLVLGLGVLVTAGVQFFYPLRLDHLLAVLAQITSMYLVFCMLGNWLSIVAPMPVAAGSLKPAGKVRLAVILQMFTAMFSLLLLVPVPAPLAAEALAEVYLGLSGLPICLVLSVLELGLLVWLYRIVLGWEGALLQAREQRILEVVAARAE